jgi:uncharacterized membrane protein YkvA (DUF1232 family)
MSDTDRLLQDEARVRDGFWRKARQTLGKVPFTEDAVAAFYCALDPATPLPIRATLFGALAYFVMPFDAIPDFIVGMGYTDAEAILIADFTAPIIASSVPGITPRRAPGCSRRRRRQRPSTRAATEMAAVLDRCGSEFLREPEQERTALAELRGTDADARAVADLVAVVEQVDCIEAQLR